MAHEVGNARVSKREQDPNAQAAELRVAGGERVFIDHGESSRGLSAEPQVSGMSRPEETSDRRIQMRSGVAALHQYRVAPFARPGAVGHVRDAFAVADTAEAGTLVEGQAGGVLGEDACLHRPNVSGVSCA